MLLRLLIRGELLVLIAEGSIEGIADEQVVSERPILFYLDNNVTSYYNLLLQLAKQ